MCDLSLECVFAGEFTVDVNHRQPLHSGQECVICTTDFLLWCTGQHTYHSAAEVSCHSALWGMPKVLNSHKELITLQLANSNFAAMS